MFFKITYRCSSSSWSLISTSGSKLAYIVIITINFITENRLVDLSGVKWSVCELSCNFFLVNAELEFYLPKLTHFVSFFLFFLFSLGFYTLTSCLLLEKNFIAADPGAFSQYECCHLV